MLTLFFLNFSYNMSLIESKDHSIDTVDPTKCKKMFLYPPHYPELEGHPIQVWVYQGKIVKRIPAPQYRTTDIVKVPSQDSLNSFQDVDSL